ncbi:MAG: FAD-dependent monooxygenase [Kiloniellales bacterium]|nr:FAD-dependent monooxygenase [Kiloniellales bacterium]
MPEPQSPTGRRRRLAGLQPEVVVAGAGPAGVLTAILLTRLGREVLLLAGGRRRPRIEGLSQRVVEVLKRQGLDRAAAAVGPSVRREVLWNGEAGARNLEHVTPREAFDAALRQDAEVAGVHVQEVRRLTLEEDAAGAGLDITGPDGERHRIRPEIFVEARGRAAPGPKARQIRGPETTAITRRIAGGDARAGTALESFPDGWAWYVADGADAFLQIFLDSRDGLPKRAALPAVFERAAAQLTLIAGVIGAGRTAGAVTTRNATPYLSRDLTTHASLRIGDAALAVDPLSGHGVFEALGSALAAAAVVNTLIARPERRALARRFHEERARSGFLRACRIGRDFYALERRWPERPFWQARAAWPDPEAAHRPAGEGDLVVEPRPVVETGLIVERRVVVTPDQPRGIWRVDETPLAELLDLLRDRQGLRLADCAGELAGRLSVTERQLATALDWLRARRLLATGTEVRLQTAALRQVEAPPS